METTVAAMPEPSTDAATIQRPVAVPMRIVPAVGSGRLIASVYPNPPDRHTPAMDPDLGIGTLAPAVDATRPAFSSAVHLGDDDPKPNHLVHRDDDHIAHHGDDHLAPAEG